MADNPAEQNINKPPATRSQRVVEKQNRLPANGNANANAVANAVLSNWRDLRLEFVENNTNSLRFMLCINISISKRNTVEQIFLKKI